MLILIFFLPTNTTILFYNLIMDRVTDFECIKEGNSFTKTKKSRFWLVEMLRFLLTVS